MSDVVLELKGVAKSYQRKRSGSAQVIHAARNISFQLHSQRVMAIVGESGSGKTTLARLITGLEQPDRGEIEFEGKKLSIKNRRHVFEYHRSVQMVFQDPFASVNPLNQIGYTLERPIVNYLKLSAAQVDQRVRQLLETVRLTPVDDFIKKLPYELSGGQLQRVVIARALAAQPSLIVADEPVSMLDVSIRSEILMLLSELRTNEGVSFLYITHDLTSARAIADDILVLYRGFVVEHGNAQEVARKPLHPYTKLLLNSIPNPWSPNEEDAETIDPQATPITEGGCVFYARCPFVMERCRKEEPMLHASGGDRAVACFLYGGGGEQRE